MSISVGLKSTFNKRMKIVHITGIYVDGWGYQENLLPQYQNMKGDSVVVVADNDHLSYMNNPDLAKEILNKGQEYWNNGIKVYKIRTYLNTITTSFFCKGLYSILEKEKPEMIFHHNVNVSTLTVAARYKKKHPSVKLYADNHVDWINETKNRLWHFLFYDLIMPTQVRMLGNRVDYYIGVTPLRCKYLNKVFHVPEEKVRFLPIGCDTERAFLIKSTREVLRKTYGLSNDAFVIASGGKIDRSKGTLELIAACDFLRKKGDDVRLVLFGKIDDEVGSVADTYGWVTRLGWCDRTQTLSVLKMSDVACWPWLHTTLIEDSVACGTPLVVKMSDNVSHFARENAGVFMKSGDRRELIDSLTDVKTNMNMYRGNAVTARDKYSYLNLVKLLDKGLFCQY